MVVILIQIQYTCETEEWGQLIQRNLCIEGSKGGSWESKVGNVGV